MVVPRVVAFVMAGGEGSRLRPLTHACPKPALPFAGGHLIIDFVLSNLYHSSVSSTYVLMQYRPQPLLSHIEQNWAGARTPSGRWVKPMLSDDCESGGGFKGTADAVRQCLHVLESSQPDVVAVFAADHVYRMDVRQMVAFHETREADVTVAAVPVPIELASAFGVICANSGGRIHCFQEKPSAPAPIPGSPRYAFASMGNYLFRPNVLRDALRDAAARGEYDFGRHVLPRLVPTHRVYAYDFSTNTIPGTQRCEDRAYWRDVGTVEAYVAAHWDLLGPHPRFCLDNPEWPIYPPVPASRVDGFNGAKVHNSIVGPDTESQGASLRHTVLQRGSCVETGAALDHCIVMNGARVGRGARLRNVIVGGGSSIGPGARIGPAARSPRASCKVNADSLVLIASQPSGRVPARAYG